MEREARKARTAQLLADAKAAGIPRGTFGDKGAVHAELLPTVPVDPVDGRMKMIGPEKAKAVAKALGMTTLTSDRCDALGVLGEAMSRVGIVKVGRGMYMMNADRIQWILKRIKRELRALDGRKSKNADKNDTPEDSALRQDLMKLYGEVVMKSQKIALEMVDSDKTAEAPAGGDGGGVPSFRPGAAITAVNVTVNNTPNKAEVEPEP